MTLIHTLSRGVDKRRIFLDDRDYLRFIHDLFEFNNQELITNTRYNLQNIDIARRYVKPRKLLVDILAFCLMPNHYHLLLLPKIEHGISLFMKKINMGYAKYFNIKYGRVGTLFEGRYKSVLVEKEAHFIHLPYYIHCNPLDLKHIEWRDRELSNYTSAINFLNTYRWSSHLDYLGKENFPSVISREFLSNFFDEASGYRNRLEQWLQEISISSIKNIILE